MGDFKDTCDLGRDCVHRDMNDIGCSERARLTSLDEAKGGGGNRRGDPVYVCCSHDNDMTGVWGRLSVVSAI